MSPYKRSVFFVSDGTGITAETLGHALLTQFDLDEAAQVSIPFADSRERIADAVTRINAAADVDEARPLVFSTLVDAGAHELLCSARALVLDLFGVFLQPLETELGQQSAHALGRSHAISNRRNYHVRMEAVNFALQHDDGSALRNYERADLILTGVSRSGKTPTCIYLAMQFGIKAANYPITEEDLESTALPNALRGHAERLFGLTIDPAQLRQIREERRPNSRYSSLSQCRLEVEDTERLFRKHHIPYLDTTSISIEEIASKVLQAKGLQRQLY